MYPYPRSPFSRFAKWTAHATGDPLAFVLAAFTIVVWLVTGPAVRVQQYQAVGDQLQHDDRQPS
jgi:low affinity Fe/Cu permease